MKMRRSGFTLIELLVVIDLQGSGAFAESTARNAIQTSSKSPAVIPSAMCAHCRNDSVRRCPI